MKKATIRSVTELLQLGKRHAHHLLVFLLLAVSVGMLLPPATDIPHRINKDYNEGWNAYRADRAIGEGELYPSFDELTGNNYPPLSFYVVGAAGAVVGDNIVAGRAVALASLLVVAASIALSIRFLGGSLFASFVPALFFVGFFSGRYTLFVAMNDPQLLGQALMMTGLVCFLRSRQQGPLFIASVVLMFAGGMTKHNLIALPLAVTAWLLFYNRPALWRWIAASAVAVVAFLGVSYVSYGENFFQGLLLVVPRFWQWRMAHRIDEFYTPLLPILGLNVVAAVFLWSSPAFMLIVLYAAIATVWSIYIAGAGTDLNSVFDLTIALTLGVGLFLHAVESGVLKLTSWRQQLQVAIVFMLLASVSIVVPKRYLEVRAAQRAEPERRLETKHDVEFLAAPGGAVMCETLSLCYWSGKRQEVDYYLTGSKMKAGLMEQDKFIELIEARHFDVIQITNLTVKNVYFPAGVTEKIFENYIIGRTSKLNGLFLVPKTAEGSSERSAP